MTESIVDVLIAAATACGEFDATRGIKRYPPTEHGGAGAFPLFTVTRRKGTYTKHTTDGQIHLATGRIECSIVAGTKAAENADADGNAFGELERLRNAYLDSLFAQTGPPVGAAFSLVSDDAYPAEAAFDGTDCVVCDFVVTCDTDLDLI